MKKKEVNSARVPIYRDAGFELENAVNTAATFANEPNHERDPETFIYSRYRNPTVVAAEDSIMAIEGSKWALLTQSGMSAIDTAISIFQEEGRSGKMLFFTEIYGGTVSYIESVLKFRRGIEIISFYADGGKYNLNTFEDILKTERPSLVYFESISNPMLIVADVEEIITLSRKYGATTLIDNTFATAHMIRPLDLGADIVIHSATKYLSGHGNLTAGVICGNDSEMLKNAIEYRKFVGHMLSPDDAYRLSTHLLSFNLRFVAQCSNAISLARRLSMSESIAQVWYPGLEGHVTYDSAVKNFEDRGFGAMITFDMAGGTEEEKRQKRDAFIKGVYPEIKLIPTLGDPHTILLPVEAVWGSKYKEPGMIRMSVGFEDYAGLEKVIARGLNAASGL